MYHTPQKVKSSHCPLNTDAQTSALYNPVATESLIKQIQSSLHGISKIIENSKKTIQQTQIKSPKEKKYQDKNPSTFKFDLSCNISFSGEESELNYSLTPQRNKVSPEVNVRGHVKIDTPEKSSSLRKKIIFQEPVNKVQQFKFQHESDWKRYKTLADSTTQKKNQKNFYLYQLSPESYAIHENPIHSKHKSVSNLIQKCQKTCIRNELENLLGLNHIIEKEAFGEKNGKLQKSFNKNTKVTNKINRSKSSQNKLKSPLVCTPPKKPNYIDKFTKKLQHQTKQKKQPSRWKKNKTEGLSNSQIVNSFQQRNLGKFRSKSKKYQQKSLGKSSKESKKLIEAVVTKKKYSHPKPVTPKKKISMNPSMESSQVSERIAIKEHFITKKLDRESFILKMKEQCYVKRFLKQTQLSQLYTQLINKKIPPYMWQQKAIEKIFQKIHDTDNIF